MKCHENETLAVLIVGVGYAAAVTATVRSCEVQRLDFGKWIIWLGVKRFHSRIISNYYRLAFLFLLVAIYIYCVSRIGYCFYIRFQLKRLFIFESTERNRNEISIEILILAITLNRSISLHVVSKVICVDFVFFFFIVWVKWRWICRVSSIPLWCGTAYEISDWTQLSVDHS